MKSFNILKPTLITLAMVSLALSVAIYAEVIRPVLNPTPSFANTLYSDHAEMSNDTILAYSIGKMISNRGKSPRPSPDKPKVGDTCPQCDGTGREPGDGTVNISCGQCKGDGRLDEGDPFFGDDGLDEIEEPEPVTIESNPPSFQRIEIPEERLKRVTVNIEGVVYTYDPKNGYFYMPDRSRILSIDPIMPDNIDNFKAIETCIDASGLCKQYLLRDE